MFKSVSKSSLANLAVINCSDRFNRNIVKYHVTANPLKKAVTILRKLNTVSMVVKFSLYLALMTSSAYIIVAIIIIFLIGHLVRKYFIRKQPSQSNNMEKTIEHLNFLCDFPLRTISHYDGQDIKRVPYFYFGILERLNAAAKGLRLLVGHIKDVPEGEFSAGLVLRTSILDFLIGLRGYDIYITNKANGMPFAQNETEVTEYCNKVLADGLGWALRHFSHFQSEGAITQDQLNALYENLAKTYPAFLNPYQNDGNAPTLKFGKPDNNVGLFKALSQNAQFKELAKHYDTYSFYSKYEHFNIMSYVLMRRLEHEQLTTLKNSIEMLVLSNFICTSMLNDFIADKFISDRHIEAGKYIKEKVFGIM